jgi:hypothetical protein
MFWSFVQRQLTRLRFFDLDEFLHHARKIEGGVTGIKEDSLYSVRIIHYSSRQFAAILNVYKEGTN